MTNILIILGRASRFDIANAETLAGPARQWLDAVLDDILGPGTYTYKAIYASDYLAKPKLDFTPSHVLCCGEECLALNTFAGQSNLDTARGIVHVRSGTRILLTYHPQDCCDLRNVDGDVFDTEDVEDSIDASSTGKDSAPTLRANYAFWFRADAEKLFDKRPVVYHDTFSFLGLLPADECVRYLNAVRAEDYFYFDIETHPQTESLQVFSFATQKSQIYTFAVYDWRGRLTPGAVSVMVALAKVFRRANIVIHNACFDLPFLAVYHGVPFGKKLHDTMLMWHRLFPESEKSLAHVISYFTNFGFHKDEAVTFNPKNRDLYIALASYNAKDVHRLRIIHEHLLTAAGTDPGLAASMELANRSIYPYILASLRGFDLDTAALRRHREALRSRADFLIRVFRILVGSREFNPASPKQLAEYLYTGMEYKAPERSDSGAPSTGASAIYKLLLKHPENVALTVLLEIRSTTKQLSMLGFQAFAPFKRR